jgi:hypothetical protein
LWPVDVLIDVLRRVGVDVGHRQHGNLVAILRLHLGQDFGKRGAVRAVGLQELQHQHLAAIIGQIVKLAFRSGRAKPGARRAPSPAASATVQRK